MSDELPLTIEWKSVADFFSCPVCMCQFTNTHVTVCGHRYCEKCIRECVDIHHKCPCCNKHLKQEQVIRDHQYDDLVAVTAKQKEISEKKYFDNIINIASEDGDHDNTNNNKDPMKRILSPVEHVLKEHLKNSLASHERYYQELKAEFIRKKNHIEEELEANQQKLYDQGLGSVDMGERLEVLHTEAEEQNQQLNDDMQRCGQMVAEAFDKYLSEHIPSLAILPVTVTLSLLNKSIQMTDVNIQAHHSMTDIKHMVRQQMELKGDSIVEFSDDVTFLSFGPLAKRSLYEMHRMAQDIVELGAQHSDIIVLPHTCRPILEYQLKPGSEIALYGRIKCESDLPKLCFATTFESDQSRAVDYFTCKDCKFNWVCRPCMESCHKEHNVAPYIMNHRPTWACCYCPKKKKCILRLT